MRGALAAAILGISLGGCFQNLDELNSPPKLSPVGAGLTQPAKPLIADVPAATPAYVTRASLWQDAGADLFRDPRAAKVGDVVTVKISIKDQASLSNTSNASRQSTAEMNVTNTANLTWQGTSGTHINSQTAGQLDPKVQATSQSQSQGGVVRSESIDLLIGAIVTSVLPNGNLVVSGRQEVLVNFELRELLISGIVRPRDIMTDNSISYDKIAEARISYGGRGRVTEVQQPGWGQQLINKFSPF
ncbi:MAG: flagellar basal body L-ring protein FlgH [Rhodomicrobium sp.]